MTPSLKSKFIMTITEFKQQHGVQGKVKVLKGKGRMFADMIDKAGNLIRLFCSEDCDLKKPLFVNMGEHNALWVCNNCGSTEVGEL